MKGCNSELTVNVCSLMKKNFGINKACVSKFPEVLSKRLRQGK